MPRGSELRQPGGGPDRRLVVADAGQHPAKPPVRVRHQRQFAGFAGEPDRSRPVALARRRGFAPPRKPGFRHQLDRHRAGFVIDQRKRHPAAPHYLALGEPADANMAPRPIQTEIAR